MSFDLFLFFLPLYEAPKNVFSVLFVLTGLATLINDRKLLKVFKENQGVCWAFLFIAMSSFFAGIDSPYSHIGERFGAALNWSLMPLVSLVMMLVDFSSSQLLRALRVFCLGTVVAVSQAFYSWDGAYPELNSVGHVNQSALYLGFCVFPVAMLMFTRKHGLDIILSLCAFLAIFLYQGPARSLVAFGSLSIVLLGLWVWVLWQKRYFKLLISCIAVLPILISSMFWIPSAHLGPFQHLKEEFVLRVNSENDLFSQRDLIMNSALEVAGDSLLGFGLGNFGEATSEKALQAWVERRGGSWEIERSRYVSTSHGHNIFANVLVERGWVGVISMVGFLVALFIILIRQPRDEITVSGILVLLTVIVAGFAQSTLHVEHGQLVFVSLAFSLLLSKKVREKEV